jgi:hypothetical protein
VGEVINVSEAVSAVAFRSVRFGSTKIAFLILVLILADPFPN